MRKKRGAWTAKGGVAQPKTQKSTPEGEGYGTSVRACKRGEKGLLEQLKGRFSVQKEGIWELSNSWSY